jgi:glycosyltransferase involved in cell wall biosynthesis
VDLDRFRRLDASRAPGLFQNWGIPAGASVVAIIANLRPVKDIPLFLEAAKEVAAQVPEARFLIIGDGPLKPQLEAYAAELGIRDRVFFAGSTNDISEYLGHVKVGCLEYWAGLVQAGKGLSSKAAEAGK